MSAHSKEAVFQYPIIRVNMPFDRSGGRNSMVECQLPKLEVAGSSPVARSTKLKTRLNYYRCLLVSGFATITYVGEISAIPPSEFGQKTIDAGRELGYLTADLNQTAGVSGLRSSRFGTEPLPNEFRFGPNSQPKRTLEFMTIAERY